MQVNECMTRDVHLVPPDFTIEQTAHLMAERDVGSLVVADNDKLIGIVTDRDLAVRCLAKRVDPQTSIRDIMSPGVKYCYDDQEIDDVTFNMGEQQIRRLPVLNREKRLVGILSLGDVASENYINAGQAMEDISRRNLDGEMFDYE